MAVPGGRSLLSSGGTKGRDPETTERLLLTASQGFGGHALRGARWTVLDRWAVKVIGLATFAVLAYLLDAKSFGVVAAAQAVILLLQPLADQGISQALIIEPEVEDDFRDTAFWLTITTGVAGAGIIFFTAPLVAAIFSEPTLAPVMRVLAGYFVIRSLGIVPEAMTRRELKFAAVAARGIFSTVVSSVVGISLALSGAGVWALVAQMLCASLTAAVLMWFSNPFVPRLRLSRAAAKKIVTFGWKAILIDFLTMATTQGDNLIVGIVLGPVALGYYAIAYRLFNAVVDGFSGVVSSLTLPIFSRLRDQPGEMLRVLRRASRMLLSVTAPVFGSLFLAAPVLVPLLFGSQWSPSIVMFQILALAGIVSPVSYLDRGVVLAAGRAGTEVIVAAIAAVMTVGGALVGARFGLIGVAVAVAARMILSIPVGLYALRRAIALSPRWYVLAWRAPLAAGMALVVVGLGVSAVLGSIPEAVRIALTVGFGLGAYVVCLAIFGRDIIRDSMRFVRVGKLG